MSTIAQITSVHRRDDTRVLLKECRSLAAAGHVITLIVADSRGDQQSGDVIIRDVGAPRWWALRPVVSTWRVLRAARRLDADVYHFHDPELIPVGLWLKLRGSRVVFDVHEDLGAQLLTKPYLRPRIARVIASIADRIERFGARRFDAIVAATPHIGTKFDDINPRTIVVNNYPLLDELGSGKPWTTPRRSIAYVGGMSEIRGLRNVVAAMEHVDDGVELVMVGTFTDSSFEAELRAMPGWERIRYLGFGDRQQVRDALAECFAGLVTFHPAPNHVNAQPNKMFEYMAAGIAVIASDFPAWREVIVGSGTGLCVDPLDPAAIATAINALAADPATAETMGQAGRQLVETTHNWANEETKLLALYDELLADDPT
jgi:glycosyltransferase involved in cell wall biosynthesis